MFLAVNGSPLPALFVLRGSLPWGPTSQGPPIVCEPSPSSPPSSSRPLLLHLLLRLLILFSSSSSSSSATTSSPSFSSYLLDDCCLDDRCPPIFLFLFLITGLPIYTVVAAGKCACVGICAFVYMDLMFLLKSSRAI